MLKLAQVCLHEIFPRKSCKNNSGNLLEVIRFLPSTHFYLTSYTPLLNQNRCMVYITFCFHTISPYKVQGLVV